MTLAVLIVAAVVALGGCGGLVLLACRFLEKGQENYALSLGIAVLFIVLTFLSGVPL